MRLLLVNPAESLSSTCCPPIHLWSMRSNLPGHTVRIWDDGLTGSLLTALTFRTYEVFNDIFGVSARFSSQHQDMLSYAYIGKGVADQTHIGGTHAAFAPDVKWLKNDIGPTGICRDGFGENYLRKLVGLSPLVYDDLAHPTFDSLELESYWFHPKPHDKTLTSRWLPIEFSRGCTRSCTFCSSRKFFKGRHRHSPEWIRAYLTYAKKAGVEELLIEDDSFDFDDEWTWNVLDILHKLSLKWSAPNGVPARPLLNTLTDYIEIKLMLDNCWRLSLPFETGSPNTAKLMGLGSKWLRWEEAYELVLKLKKANIQACGFFIIGYPGETSEDIRHTLAYANSLPLDDRYIYCATPYPGTTLFDLCLEEKYLDFPPGDKLYSLLSYRSSVITTSSLTSGQVTNWRQLDQDLHQRSLKL